MSVRDRYEPGVPCWVDLLVDEPDTAMSFYAGLFGWEFTAPGPMPDGGRYHVARLHGADVAGIGSMPATDPPAPAAWNTYVSVASADAAAERARKAGATVLAGPFDALPAGRGAVLSAPDGALVCLWEPRERQGAQRVNEPSTWAMSVLQTPDPDGRRRRSTRRSSVGRCGSCRAIRRAPCCGGCRVTSVASPSSRCHAMW